MAFPWDQFNAATELLEAVLVLPYTIADIFLTILMVTFYPVISAINIFLVNVQDIAYSVVTFGNAIYGTADSAITLLGTFDAVFPSTWTALMGAAIMIMIALRVYKLLPIIGGG